MAKWYIRKNIIGYDATRPEDLSTKKQNFFIIYALITWVYRFFLFLGIAFLVYHFAFKVLGIILFLVEIVWFILLPIYSEIRVWIDNKQKIKLNSKNKKSLIVLAMILATILVPWNNKITLPAVLEIKEYTKIYPSIEGQIQKIYYKNGDYVKKGELILQLTSPSLDLAITQCKQEIDKLSGQINKYASQKDILDNITLLQEKLSKKQKELIEYEKTNENLQVYAPFSGYIYYTTSYSTNMWVSPRQALFALYDPSDTKISAFCPEDRLSDIDTDSYGYFIPSVSLLDDIDVHITHISDVSIPYLQYYELSSQYGGDIATRVDTQDKLYSEKAYYQINATVQKPTQALKQRTKGTLVLHGTSRSIATLFITKSLSTLIKESGF